MNGLSALTCHSCGLIQGVEDRPGAKKCVCVCRCRYVGKSQACVLSQSYTIE